MAKSKPAAKAAPKAPTNAAPAAKKTKSAPAPAAESEETEAVTEAVARTRGPRGTTEDAVITVLVEGNPKREGSKAHQVFSHYVSGQTIAEFCASLDDAELGKEATPNLVYDSKHGFIEIAGYTPPGGVTVKEVKPKKEPKAKKAKAAAEADPEADAAAEEETID